MKISKSILLHFYDTEDLLHGIDVLQHYQVPICEIYTPRNLQGIESKLRIRAIRLGHTVLKYGCLGGATLTTLAYYIFEQGDLTRLSGSVALTLALNVGITLVTFFFATRLFPEKTPKVITLKRRNNKYLMTINANGIVPNDDITNLFKYAEAVEVSSAIKNMITA